MQACIVHLISHSLSLASWKDLIAQAAALKLIYRADHAEAADRTLSDFEARPLGERFETVVPFFAFSAEVRKRIYTTNAIESMHSGVRKAIRNKGHCPNDEVES